MLGESLLKRILEALREVEPQLVLLHGSYARGDFLEGVSDVDLLVVSERFRGVPIGERISLLAYALRRITPPVEAVGYTLDELLERIEGLDPYVLAAVEEGVVVLDEGVYPRVREKYLEVKRRYKLRRIEGGWAWEAGADRA